MTFYGILIPFLFLPKYCLYLLVIQTACPQHIFEFHKLCKLWQSNKQFSYINTELLQMKIIFIKQVYQLPESLGFKCSKVSSHCLKVCLTYLGLSEKLKSFSGHFQDWPNDLITMCGLMDIQGSTRKETKYFQRPEHCYMQIFQRIKTFNSYQRSWTTTTILKDTFVSPAYLTPVMNVLNLFGESSNSLQYTLKEWKKWQLFC